MTKEEVATLIFDIYNEYEEYIEKDDIVKKTLLWYQSLKDYDNNTVRNAFLIALERNKYIIRLADIMEVLMASEPTDEELWAEVRGLVKKVLENKKYGRLKDNDKIFDNLSDINKSYFVSVTELEELATAFGDERQEQFQIQKAVYLKRIPIIRQTIKARKRL